VNLAVLDPDVAVEAVRFVAAIDHEALAERGRQRTSAEHLPHALEVDRRAIAAVVRFVGELADRFRRV
jgi:hypothetical protein